MQELCTECGVPSYFSSQHLWLNNGDIINATLTHERLTFLEFEFFDHVIHETERTLGTSIERIVIATAQAAVRMYVASLLPEGVGDMIRAGTLSLDNLHGGLIEVAALTGFGRYEERESRYQQDEEDYHVVSIKRPFSVYLTAATHGAAYEAMLGYDHDIRYSEAAPGVYEITAFPSSHPEDLRERLAPRMYEHRDGDLELERCGTCGVPKLLQNLSWNVEEGTITSKITGRRLSISGPNLIMPIFEELEKELGKEIPALVVDAVRDYARGGLLPQGLLEDEEAFRHELAMRGLGNLGSLQVDARELNMLLRNVCLPPVVVGLVQGMHEELYGVRSRVEWSVDEAGDLRVALSA